jgi:hypothetical protein
MDSDGDEERLTAVSGASLQGAPSAARARVEAVQIRTFGTSFEIDLLLAIDGGGQTFLRLSKESLLELLRMGETGGTSAADPPVQPKESNH